VVEEGASEEVPGNLDFLSKSFVVGWSGHPPAGGVLLVVGKIGDDLEQHQPPLIMVEVAAPLLPVVREVVDPPSIAEEVAEMIAVTQLPLFCYHPIQRFLPAAIACWNGHDIRKHTKDLGIAMLVHRKDTVASGPLLLPTTAQLS
jgi:hypothetical protein